ncbi:MAG: methionine adenosyltransferase [Candidatus Harrisonbacteria bacterium RIFCSPLOWO2_02_FULL_41_13b]|uniref:Methionine adenosyltransferase n=1 Tax=Candidatus Harrisonbacteria bacterium RIFCSPLOWO2_02_FULL_41_13b TaxID=1798409 RepID=A0A1G1ZQE6_9BACT|nr:MAG: methionine adenosyltransferase [Candidatus Harrisonbacteria bacterium RIFCSPHIGHO2_02_FULL_40_20]OGY66762.1 MAG: methionine adenosyltransferase [Candidatus Harrisonbacteria bacterium RIFCSPLOWO2_02_FULL_41_13b]
MYNPKIYTVESVTSGHPDKICDQISDTVLDECLKQDPESRVAIETFGSHGLLVVGGEITTKAKVDFEKVAREVYQDIGYKEELKIIINVVQQSPDIAQGVDTGGAGDQGIMYGYATNETPEFLQKGVVLVHQLTSGLEKLRTSGSIIWLKPDGKSQVTMDGSAIKTLLVSTQHDEKVAIEDIKKELVQKLISPLVENVSKIQVLVNPTGRFVNGGFYADTGLTGRKIMVDTYGGLIPHGGGCFSGKDPTKVDRSAAYMARFVAKNIVANSFAKTCLVSVAYAIGKATPLMVEILNESGEDITNKVKGKFDFRPLAIIERLNLRRPIYRQTASYGHFGKADLPWEEIINL